MKKSRPALIALTAALALGITACGSSDDSDETTSSSASATSGAGTSSEDPTEESSSDDRSSASSTASSGGSDDTGLEAVREAITAAEEQAGGDAYEVDDQEDDGTWEVDVAKGSQSIEVEVTGDGTATIEDEDDLDDEDRAGLKAATITVTDAIETALKEVDGTFDDVELEGEDGEHRWEVTVDDSKGDDREVTIDVTDGSVVSTDNGDDDTDDDNDDD